MGQPSVSSGLLDKWEQVKTNETTAEENKLHSSGLSVG